ncbi:Sodium/proton antiporter NhaA [Hartmannibacter diazotrophicus]|uniref:Na(+)/H(+) antiporter NhaA n=1 Tax=Hartmannibacter diazotrophicus TaxID=1482074 RepID=A0A2C9DB38_9HYPH|nr:Na+/H+ antiporter NhaA [Hartmannibacter diazotrophicus]SON56815.1 Sodium/proton antiporter NhaA [Hartmannibacter diazotrophicus]
MNSASLTNRLDRAVDDTRDHILGHADAQITLVEYGSYACPHCRAANERIAELRDEFGERMRYVFRHRPLTGIDLARRAAELVERAPDPESFWNAHIKLMTRSHDLTEEDLAAVALDLGIEDEEAREDHDAVERARARVEADERSARASGVMFTPTFFINSRRYDGPWDENSLADAMVGRLGHRVQTAALDFVSWGPSAGLLLLLATIIAVVATNSPAGPAFENFWHHEFGLAFNDAYFGLSLLHWVNDGLLTFFFLVVGLEIKREFTVGHLAGKRSAALPIAGALGGMVVPVLIYLAIIPAGPWQAGWGIPMATDTAFAVALIVVMGRRVPVELRVLLTAAAIVDDIGGILVVAVFYSSDLHLMPMAGAVLATGALALLNKMRIYRVAPYMLVGLVLWAFVHASGLHATLAGVILALFIPARQPPNYRALMVQATTIISAEALQGREVLRHGPSSPALRSLDAIHDRLESPSARLLRHAVVRSSFAILPLFALANAGVEFSGSAWNGHLPMFLAIVLGLSVGKPVGLTLAAALAVRMGIAVKPAEYSWRQLVGAGALAGIGFTMSLFIAGEAFPVPADFAAAKIAIFAASILSALIGVAILWNAQKESD